MGVYVQIDSDGIVQSALSQRAPPVEPGWIAMVPPNRLSDPAAQIAWGGMMDAGVVGNAYLLDGQLQPRPHSAQPTQNGNTVTIPPCPAGTVIEVYDRIGWEKMAEIVADVDGWTDTITFQDPGRYRIEVQEPPPALSSSVIMEV